MTMKKINSKMHLRAEKRRIRIRQKELEEKISCQWNELKQSLRPVNIAKETFQKVIQDKTEKNLEDESIIKSTLKYGISLLAKRFTDKAGEKFERLFNKNGH
jgi:hypothetical protein